MKTQRLQQVLSVGFFILLIAGLFACTCGPDDLTLKSNVKANLSADKTIPADSISVSTLQGVVTLSGAVNSESEKSSAEEIAKAVTGAKSVINNITVNPSAASTAQAVPSILPSAPVSVEAAVAEATQKASDALAGLQPGFTAEELINALNLQIINFASGSAEIPKESMKLLKESAEAIKAAPQGTVIEIDGHTDSRGNAASNEKLSRQRAEAVRAFLIEQGVNSESLTAKGYGAGKPIAGNDTAEGRFKNRRIEYAVVK